MPKWSQSLPPRHSATGQFTSKTVSFAPQPSDTLMASTSLELAATSSPRSALGLSQLFPPKGISSPLISLPPVTKPRDNYHLPMSPSFHLHPTFDFGLMDNLSEPWTPPTSLSELPLTPVHNYTPCRSDSFSPLRSLPIDTSTETSYIRNLATCFTSMASHPT